MLLFVVLVFENEEGRKKKRGVDLFYTCRVISGGQKRIEFSLNAKLRGSTLSSWQRS